LHLLLASASANPYSIKKWQRRRDYHAKGELAIMESGELGLEAGRVKEAAASSDWKKIIDHPDLEIYWPSRTTVVGFLVAWGFVALIIAIAMVLARIGA
jgi:hypothetical protein